MCNPSPQGRCQGDASKAVASKISSFAKTFEDFTKRVGEDKANDIAGHFAKSDPDFSRNDPQVAKALGAVNEAKAFLYATPAAQKNPAEVAKKVAELEADLSPLQQSLLKETNGRARRTGKFLSKFQEVARKTAKQDPEESSIATARLMAQGEFSRAKHLMRQSLDQSHKEELAKAMRETPGAQQGLVRGQLLAKHLDNVKALNTAYDYAVADAKDSINKDIDKNSATYSNTIDKHKFGFYKRENGSFTVNTSFEVKAKTLGEAIEKAEGSFDLEDVQFTISDPENGVYPVRTSYVYKGGESIEDAKKFQKKAWKGTPQWRETQRQAKMLDDFYDQDHKQGKYAMK